MTTNNPFPALSGSMTFNNPEFWRFIAENMDSDTSRLRLKAREGGNNGFDIMKAILQIDARRRFGKKLASTLESFDRFYFPDLLAGEQSTSDRAAMFHERFVESGESLVDMTSGLGIDLTHLAHKASVVTGVERKPELAEALEWNSHGLGLANVRVLCSDSTEIINSLPDSDVVFIDPARRSTDGERVFGLTDCEPDVTALLPELKKKFKKIVLKASPMLDVSRTIIDLPGVTDIYILGTPTECKELDAIIHSEEDNNRPVRIHAVTLFGDERESELVFTREEEADAPTPLMAVPVVGGYLYEPSPAIMKAAPFKLTASKFGVNKLSNNTHLYFANELKEFPGETFKIIEVVDWQSKHIKRFKNRYPRISVTTRNFGMSADALRSKLGVKDGGNERLFAVTTANDRRLMIVAHRVEM